MKDNEVNKAVQDLVDRLTSYSHKYGMNNEDFRKAFMTEALQGAMRFILSSRKASPELVQELNKYCEEV